MRALVQRVARANVRVAGDSTGEIGAGLLVFLGVTHDDGDAVADEVARRVSELRVFPDAEHRMNLDVRQSGGAVLVVPQFTLYGDTRRGRRPDFTGAARPEIAAPLVDRFCAALEARGLTVARGRFGASMQVELVNDGPVTLLVECEPRAGTA